MSPVMILTDSSAYLPPDLVDRHPIRVIPLTLNWKGRSTAMRRYQREIYRSLSPQQHAAQAVIT